MQKQPLTFVLFVLPIWSKMKTEGWHLYNTADVAPKHPVVHTCFLAPSASVCLVKPATPGSTPYALPLQVL